jgi:hypothetical protein
MESQFYVFYQTSPPLGSDKCLLQVIIAGSNLRKVQWTAVGCLTT